MNIETKNLKLIDYRIIENRGFFLIMVKCSPIKNPDDIREYFIIDDCEKTFEEALIYAMENGSKLDDLAKKVNQINC